MVTSPTTATSLPTSTPPREGILLAGVALSSFAALLLELALTRLFSVILFYHFAFLAISVALLGLGAGGVFAYVRREKLARVETRPLAARLCAMNALTVVAVLGIVLRVPLPVWLALTWGNCLRLTLLYVASAAPFFFTGVTLSVVFARETRHITRLYGADLAGGAAACLAIVPLLNGIGGPNAILFSGLVTAVAAAVWSVEHTARKVLAGLASIFLVLIIANHGGKLFDIIYAKGMFRDPSFVEFARWNAISRVEVDRQGNSRVIVIDADASTFLMNADVEHFHGSKWEKLLMSAPPALANMLRPHGDYAIIGPGGGVDVVRALGNGSPSVTGIEINPIIANTIMRERYADYAYHLYQHPKVHIEVTDGRSYVRNSQQKFDVVQMTLVDTWASTAAGAFALSENNLYTVEAFREYFEHLKPDGIIAVTRWEFKQPREALRVVSVAMEALHQLGVGDCSRHFIVVSEGDLDVGGIPVVVLAKRTAFTDAEREQAREFLKMHPALVPLYLEPARSLIGGELQPAYVPSGESFAELIQSNQPRQFAERYPYDVSPVTDNAPFFFFTLKTGQVLSRTTPQGIDWKVNLGVAVLGMVLVISLVAVLGFLLVPLVWAGGRKRQRALPLLYFVAIGLGYIMVEIAFIQRFVLFLGHPTYALTVVIFLLLLSSGAGSLASRQWLSRAGRGWAPLPLIVAVLGVYVFALPGVLASLVGLPFGVKLVVSGIFLVPLGFAMGMPFPTGLRALASMPAQHFAAAEVGAGSTTSASKENAVEWAWAMNAAASVFGSVVAMAIAVHFGLNATLASGAIAYLSALALFGNLEPAGGM